MARKIAPPGFGPGGKLASAIMSKVMRAKKTPHHASKSGALIKSGGSVKATVKKGVAQMRPASVAGNKLLKFKPGATSSNFNTMIKR